ncbi:uncharacterized protein LOC111630306 [Centruroides sculpturatus]|uniref:uncharacterized protein LOC111630306 n=1 Tax=Centruroides sculpturatus TaxID=218467 RepID=UPI000C6D53A7|nr:uncharacterized protein LOC111630306 [Centruroides sculpturatus]
MKENYRMASLDVNNMYPSINLELILTSLSYVKSPDWINQLVKLVLNNNFFEFQGKYYRQSEGIPMGSCIGPRLAELCMITIDKEINKTQGIISYQRYVDDCFIIYDKSILDIDSFVCGINLINKNVQFQCEKEVDNRLNYLDLTVVRLNGKLLFKKYVKDCATDKVIDFKSNIPLYIKKNTFQMYINKIKERTTLHTDQEMEIQNIIRMFNLNNYPRTLLIKWLEASKGKRKNISLNRQPIDVKTVYLKIEYVFGVFEKLKNELKRLDIILVPNHKSTIANLLNSKHGNIEHNVLEKDNVVYSLDCSCSHKKRYVGETGRKLKTRIKEHIYAIKNNLISSSVAQHCNTEGCEILKDSIKCIMTENNQLKRRLQEHLEILKIQEDIRINNNMGLKLHEGWIDIVFT